MRSVAFLSPPHDGFGFLLQPILVQKITIVKLFLNIIY